MNCLICKSNQTFFYHKFDNYSTHYEVYKCSFCKSLFQTNIKNYTNYYSKEYYIGDSDYNYYDERKYFSYNKYVWESRLKNIKKFIPKGNILDIGCAFGGFLQIASKYYQSYGLDISKYAVQKGIEWAQTRAKQNKINDISLHQGDCLHLPRSIKHQKFDIVTLIEVAEHLANPRKVFQKIFNIMNPKGLLLIQTANFEGEQAIQEGKKYHYFMPGHLVYYTASGIKKLLSEIGYKRFIEYIPVDFSLIAKMRKSQGYFQNIIEYKKWISIASYHLKSKMKTKKGNPKTSSYVLYAFK